MKISSFINKSVLSIHSGKGNGIHPTFSSSKNQFSLLTFGIIVLLIIFSIWFIKKSLNKKQVGKYEKN